MPADVRAVEPPVDERRLTSRALAYRHDGAGIPCRTEGQRREGWCRNSHSKTRISSRAPSRRSARWVSTRPCGRTGHHVQVAVGAVCPASGQRPVGLRVPGGEAHACAMFAKRQFEEAEVERFGVRVHGAGEYPEKLRDAIHPVELLYYQGLVGLTNSRSVAIVGYPDAVARRARAHRAPEYALVAELPSSTKYSTEAHSRAAKSSRPPVFREPRSAGCSSPGGCPIWPPLRISTMQNFELSAGFRASGRNGNTYHFPSCCHTRIAVLALFLLAGAASAKTWRGPRRGTRAPLLALLTQRLPLFAIRGTAYRNRTWSGLRPLHGTLFRRPAGDRHRAHRRLVRSARQRALHRGRRNALALRLRPAQLDAGRSRREPQPEEALRCHAVDAVDEPLLVRGPCRRSVAQVRAADRRCAGGERLGSRALGLRVYRDDRPKLRGRSINHDSRGSTERAVFRHDRCLALVGRQRERTDYVPRAGPSRLPIHARWRWCSLQMTAI